MKKIPTLFLRNSDRLVRNEVNPGCEWVLAGEGVPTIKWDGTCCMIKNGLFYKRYDAKKGKKPPDGFIPAQEPDPVTGQWPGWVRVSEKGKEDMYHREGLANTIMRDGAQQDGTYELIGPKINGNKESKSYHILVKHGENRLANIPLSFDGLREFFTPIEPEPTASSDINPLRTSVPFEGIVWHHPDGRMAKIKARDFGVKW